MINPGHYENPILRCPLLVTGHDGNVKFVDLREPNDNSLSTIGDGEIDCQIIVLNSSVIGLRKRIEEIVSIQHQDLANFQYAQRIENDRMYKAIKRIAAQPIIRASTDTTIARSSTLHTRLSKRPNNLYDLWQEYEIGFGGSKSARHFTAAERGASRFTYSLRLGFWRIVEKMVNSGHTSDMDIDRVYCAYGRSLVVVQILRRIRQDKRRGGHPDLR